MPQNLSANKPLALGSNGRVSAEFGRVVSEQRWRFASTDNFTDSGPSDLRISLIRLDKNLEARAGIERGKELGCVVKYDARS